MKKTLTFIKEFVTFGGLMAAIIVIYSILF